MRLKDALAQCSILGAVSAHITSSVCVCAGMPGAEFSADAARAGSPVIWSTEVGACKEQAIDPSGRPHAVALPLSI